MPLLRAYGAVRRLPNVCLIVGSGFGDGEDRGGGVEGAQGPVLLVRRAATAASGATANAINQ